MYISYEIVLIIIHRLITQPDKITAILDLTFDLY